jgi:sigma-B regulation protein RsbU (phosphoserine phosphatase)
MDLEPPIPPLEAASAQERLADIVDLMREISRQTDPQAMVNLYGERMERYFSYDGFLALSRRDLTYPEYRVTRSHVFGRDIDPWKERHLLPLLRGGFFADLLYAEKPAILNNLAVPKDDPAYRFVEGMGSASAIPHFDGGQGLNMIITLKKHPVGFDAERFPEVVWTSSLFGRATNSLVLSRKLKEANDALERELATVAAIQRSLLPARTPRVPGLELATYYKASSNASGDLYDFFPLPDDRWGLLIADVSGHGTPAAVVMAVVHALSHSLPGQAEPSARVLSQLNRTLAERYTADGGTFVTAFYGVFDPRARTLTYSSAGHPPPLLLDAQTGAVGRLGNAQGLPMGILSNADYDTAVAPLDPGDTLVMYTDGITEARGRDPAGSPAMYGEARLEHVMQAAARELCTDHTTTAGDVMTSILQDLDAFASGIPAGDDRTVVVGRALPG